MLATKSYFEGKKILAVDDEKDILEIIGEELDMADVDTALDGSITDLLKWFSPINLFIF